jgi:tRNA threonylcarbamoyladenosine biosynthesis protein TsaB
MNLLAFDTSTDQLSVAVCRSGSAQVWSHSGPGGAQASITLIPTILALLAQAELTVPALHAIVFGAGPGSFTGLRTACAVAQGLGYGAAVPLLPVDTLLAVAEEARSHLPNPAAPCRILALLDARMDEVYAAYYHYGHHDHDHDHDRPQAAATDPSPVPFWQQCGDWVVCKPEALSMPPAADPAWCLAGNAFAAYADRLPQGHPRAEALPTARALLRLAPALLAAGQAVPAAQALPRYIRDKVAQTSAERDAAKTARQSVAATQP